MALPEPSQLFAPIDEELRDPHDLIGGYAHLWEMFYGAKEQAMGSGGGSEPSDRTARAALAHQRVRDDGRIIDGRVRGDARKAARKVRRAVELLQEANGIVGEILHHLSNAEAEDLGPLGAGGGCSGRCSLAPEQCRGCRERPRDLEDARDARARRRQGAGAVLPSDRYNVR